MSVVLLANVTTLAEPVVTFAILIACLVLLLLRAWRETTNADLSWMVLKVLDVAIVLLTLLFLVLVVYRFKTLA